MKKVADKHGIELWSNAETFERDVRSLFQPIPFAQPGAVPITSLFSALSISVTSYS